MRMNTRNKARRSSSATPDSSHQIEPLVRLWILRILVPLQGHHAFVTQEYIREDDLGRALGLDDWLDIDEDAFDRRDVMRILREQLKAAEHQTPPVQAPTCLRHNLERLATLIGLSEADQAILQLATLEAQEPSLGTALGLLGNTTQNRMFHVLSVLLDQPRDAIRQALAPSGLLARSGLLSVERSGRARGLEHCFTLISDQFAETLLGREAEPVELLEGVVTRTPEPDLSFSDFMHIQPLLDVLIPYLKQSSAHRKPGVNILLHGQPGTGKTQLSRLLSKELSTELFEICCEDTDGEAIDGLERLRAYRSAQHFFARSPNPLLVFDEAEDLFLNTGRPLVKLGYGRQTNKAWINRLLEANPVPALWISNSTGCIDPAYLRRFDMVIELPIPSRRQRLDLIESAVGTLLDDTAKERLSAIEHLPPAILTRAAMVVREAGIPSQEGGTHIIERMINGTLKASGYDASTPNAQAFSAKTYDPALSCATANLAQIAKDINRAQSGARLCLYGPPGTGKTAWAHWLAHTLDRPLQIRRASDLLSKWVGDSEKLVAAAFTRAQEEGEILLIDEIDSFLQDRQGLEHSWEITLVNELLTCMEAFKGIFIASTNWMGRLDAAALRRFDLKVEFNYLAREQARTLYLRHSQTMDLPTPTASEWARVDAMITLTPGDFAVMRRQHQFRPFGSHAALLDALAWEQSLKPHTAKGIGFY